MSSGEWVCNQCGFTVPVDEIGKALMFQHLHDHKHAEELNKTSVHPEPWHD
jgi:ribosomal protein S26